MSDYMCRVDRVGRRRQHAEPVAGFDVGRARSGTERAQRGEAFARLAVEARVERLSQVGLEDVAGPDVFDDALDLRLGASPRVQPTQLRAAAKRRGSVRGGCRRAFHAASIVRTRAMQLVDSHCHLPLIEGGEAGFEGILARAAAAGVGHMLCVSGDLESYPAVRELARAFPQISCSFGAEITNSIPTMCDEEPIFRPSLIADMPSACDQMRSALPKVLLP